METMERLDNRTPIDSHEIDPSSVCLEGFLRYTRNKMLDGGTNSISREQMLSFKTEYLDSIYGVEDVAETPPSPEVPEAADLSHNDTQEIEVERLEHQFTLEMPEITKVMPVIEKKAKKAHKHRKSSKFLLKATAAIGIGLGASAASIPMMSAYEGLTANNKTEAQEPVAEAEVVSGQDEATEPQTTLATSAPEQMTPITVELSPVVSVTEPEVVEATLPPRAETLLESVANGERTLAEMPGTNVGTLSIEGVCLDDIQVSVTNAVEMGDIPVGTDNPEEARSLSNPIYRIERDATPQQACNIEGQSDHAPRWDSPVKGSARIKAEYSSPAELVPQANIHPYSALPGQEGVTYIQGHATTYSAPFMNLDAMRSGQIASFSDGYNSFNYVFIGYENVNPDISISEILNKTVDGKSTLIVSTCDDGEATRLLAIFVQQ